MFHRKPSLGVAVFLFLLAGSLTASAQHGGWSFGGGGMRFGGGGYGGHSGYRQSYGHNNYNYNRSYGHNNYNYNRGHQNYQPAYTPPRTNVAPRTYVAPRANPAPKTYVAPKTNVVPRTNTLAPANKPAAVTKVTPKANSVPSSLAPANKVAPSNKLPSTASNNTNVRSTKPTAQATKPKIPAAANPGKGDFVANLTKADIGRIAQQINQRDKQLVDRLEQALQAGLDRLIDSLPGAADLTPAQRQAIRDAIASGEPARLRTAIGDAATSPGGRELLDRATAADVLDAIADAIADGGFDGGDLANLIGAIQALDVPNLQDLIALVGQIAVDQQVVIWVLDTDPGMGAGPFGPDMPLVLVPGLPFGWLMPLDAGPVMIGMGAPGDEILLGMGDPLEVAGLPTPIDGAQPAAAAAAPFGDGQIILNNPLPDTVNYTLNQQPYSMATDFEQTLPAGTTWTIEFDRGGGFGLARYTLSEGYYVFSSTDRGWDLYKRTFRSTLDNTGNTFAFSYVLDDQQQTLNPGESQELSGLFPPVLRFDNGNGTELQRRLESGSYRVAVADDLTLDIYRAQDVEVPTAPEPAAAAPLVAAAPTAPAGQAPAEPVVAGRAPAPLPMPMPVANPAAQTVAARATPAASTGRRLPPGFTLFDPVAAVTDPQAARRLPTSFSLFRSAAEQMPVATTPR